MACLCLSQTLVTGWEECCARCPPCNAQEGRRPVQISFPGIKILPWNCKVPLRHSDSRCHVAVFKPHGKKPRGVNDEKGFLSLWVSAQLAWATSPSFLFWDLSNFCEGNTTCIIISNILYKCFKTRELFQKCCHILPCTTPAAVQNPFSGSAGHDHSC